MALCLQTLVIVAIAASATAGWAQVVDQTHGKPVKTSREYICHGAPDTWESLIEASDVIAVVKVASSVAGEVAYLGPNFKSVVTAHAVTVQRVVVSNGTRALPESGQLLVLVPGGTVDRGDHLERVVVNEGEPWQVGNTFLVALLWEDSFSAWRPAAFFDTTFRMLPDGTLHSTRNGPLARAANKATQAEILSRLSGEPDTTVPR
ncbi:MAG: hypothetical protein IT182_06600 [Acidobacteria bacterium]|nr:hypothetical protein [Acidobacteriota bacterium]